MPNPTVSVLMSVYNGEEYLREAVESILTQTFTDFEFLAVNDGSKDDSLAILQSYKDPRLVVLDQENQGLTVSLNRAAATAKGTYLARMDADDISFPERFAKQVAYLEAHPDVVALGTAFMIVSAKGDTTGIVPILLDNTDLRREMLYKSPFAHGSVMMRRSAAEKAQLASGLYLESAAEDYDLWSRLIEQGPLAGLAEPLYGYREYGTSLSQRRYEKMMHDKDVVAARMQRTLLPAVLQERQSLTTVVRKYPPETCTIQGREWRMDRRPVQAYSYSALTRLAIKRRQFVAAVYPALCSLAIKMNIRLHP